MSLYGINDEDDEYDIVVGWDPPLQTYFARVEPPGDTEPEDVVFAIGRRAREVPTVVALKDALEGWATIPADVLEELYKDPDREA